MAAFTPSIAYLSKFRPLEAQNMTDPFRKPRSHRLRTKNHDNKSIFYSYHKINLVVPFSFPKIEEPRKQTSYRRSYIQGSLPPMNGISVKHPARKIPYNHCKVENYSVL